MRKPIVLATRSGHKLREIRDILEEVRGPEVIDLAAAGVPYEAVEETIEAFDSFAENALAKARHFAARSGRPALADDSGICVDALGGAPGVRSKRFSGRTDLEGVALDRANNSLLLERLSDVPEGERGAHYRCVVALVNPGGEEFIFEGRCDGLILLAPRGEGGFGYDPLFRLRDDDRTFAEIGPAEKNRVSHRARVMRAFAEWFAGRNER